MSIMKARRPGASAKARSRLRVEIESSSRSGPRPAHRARHKLEVRLRTPNFACSLCTTPDRREFGASDPRTTEKPSGPGPGVRSAPLDGPGRFLAPGLAAVQ